MGIPILNQILTQLREVGFLADEAYPGRILPIIDQSVAAVHIEKVDGPGMIITAAVDICSPGSLGGTYGEEQAFRAMEVLQQMGAGCVQQSCKFDGNAQMYIVPIKASFSTAVPEPVPEPVIPFSLFLNDQSLPWAVSVEAEYDTGRDDDFRNTDGTSRSTSRIIGHWVLTIQEVVPNGVAEQTVSGDQVTVRVERQGLCETFSNSVFTNLHREYTQKGLVRIWKAIAESRTESTLT